MPLWPYWPHSPVWPHETESFNFSITKLNFSKYNPHCYFITDPFKKKMEFIEFIEKLINFSLKKNCLFIFVNCNKKAIEELKNIQCIENFYINKIQGYSIYKMNNN